MKWSVKALIGICTVAILLIGSVSATLIFNASRMSQSTQASGVHIQSISPNSGPTGTAITLVGSGFTDNNYIMIAGGYYPVGASINGGTQLRFTLPDHFSDGSGCLGPPFARRSSGLHCEAIREMVVSSGVQTIAVLTAQGQSNQVSFSITE